MKLWKKRYCKKVFSSVMAVIIAFGTFPANHVHAEQSLVARSGISYADERTKEFNAMQLFTYAATTGIRRLGSLSG